ncbi:Crp/Fnr family transcriptional regulator [Aneurinibacillus sp. Ricciae_BoGa-3]|uniref:Crp/Fnr family transcriptional regulator n=1 Tax=Aneurinibacillus sp. Ricciae_BoGa-3 TaxID=3022697 RepID=UPI0023416385|nr:Crp/Fnr family transcriptional regulator [Aneurinibacillus sp. Ricciae_BoGa-3]WCK55488.1 Crp/Fnr family transcriptional regulator [Aneurinibacillus sp. Ricciae_BoGa-3]
MNEVSNTEESSVLPEPLKDLLDSLAFDRKVEKDMALYNEGEPASNLFVIRSGKIKISKLTAQGREMTLQMCQTGDIVGEPGLFSDNAQYMTSAIVVEDSVVGVVSQQTLEHKLVENGTLAVEFMKWIGQVHRSTQSKFRDLMMNGKQGALYSTLIRMANTYGKEDVNGIFIDFPLTNQELGNFCGTTRERINRLLNELKKNRVISFKNGYITIHDLQYLKDMIDCEDCPPDICRL